MDQSVQRIEDAMRTLASYVAVTGLLLLLVLALFTLFDGLLRAFANYPLDVVREIGDLVAAVAGASCLPVVLFERGNIVLRILDGVMPKPLVKAIDLINALLILVVLIGMAVQFWLYGMKTMRGGEITWLLNIPKAPFWFVIDGLLWLTVIVHMFHVAHAAVSLRNADA